MNPNASAFSLILQQQQQMMRAQNNPQQKQHATHHQYNHLYQQQQQQQQQYQPQQHYQQSYHQQYQQHYQHHYQQQAAHYDNSGFLSQQQQGKQAVKQPNAGLLSTLALSAPHNRHTHSHAHPHTSTQPYTHTQPYAHTHAHTPQAHTQTYTHASAAINSHALPWNAHTSTSPTQPSMSFASFATQSLQSGGVSHLNNFSSAVSHSYAAPSALPPTAQHTAQPFSASGPQAHDAHDAKRQRRDNAPSQGGRGRGPAHNNNRGFNNSNRPQQQQRNNHRAGGKTYNTPSGGEGKGEDAAAAALQRAAASGEVYTQLSVEGREFQILVSNDEQEVNAWIQQRKARFPTKQRVELKQERSELQALCGGAASTEAMNNSANGNNNSSNATDSSQQRQGPRNMHSKKNKNPRFNSADNAQSNDQSNADKPQKKRKQHDQREKKQLVDLRHALYNKLIRPQLDEEEEIILQCIRFLRQEMLETEDKGVEDKEQTTQSTGESVEITPLVT